MKRKFETRIWVHCGAAAPSPDTGHGNDDARAAEPPEHRSPLSRKSARDPTLSGSGRPRRRRNAQGPLRTKTLPWNERISISTPPPFTEP